MFVLRLFGSALLEGPGGRLAGRVAQRRQLAILAYLSRHARPVARDRLLCVFWPEADTQRARHALSDAIYVIRKALGEDVIHSVGDDLMLDRTAVRTDVDAFEAALAENRFEEAVGCYTGRLLDGFHLPNTSEFEEWLEAERTRLAQAAVAAAEAAAAGRSRDGDPGGVVVWWRKAVALEPHNSRNALQLVQALTRAADPAGAMRFAATHIRLLESSYGAAPPDEFIACLNELRSQGAVEAAAQDEQDIRPAAAEPAQVPVVERSGGARTWAGSDVRTTRSPRKYARLLYATLAVILVGVLAAWPIRTRSAASVKLDTGLVLTVPFRGPGLDPELEYLREGLAELIMMKLASGSGGLRAVSPHRVRGALDARAAALDPTDDEAIAAARLLGAGRILQGSVIGVPQALSIQVALIDVESGQARSPALVHGTEQDLPVLVDRLAAEILSRSAGEEEHRLEHLLSTSLPALQTFLLARAAHRRGEYHDALRLYTRALDMDSTFALAGIAAYAVSGWVGGSAPEAARGLRLARQHHDRLSERDRVGLFGRLDVERDDAVTVTQRIREVEEALRRFPDHPRLWYVRGDLLMHHGPALGLEDWALSARESFERALALDADYAEPIHHLATTLGILGDTASLRTLATVQLARLPRGPVADHLRWRARHALGEPFREPPLDSMDTDATLRWIGIEAQDYGFALDEGTVAVQKRLEQPGIRDQRFERRMGALAYALNGGKPAQAVQVLESLRDVQPDPDFQHRIAILTSLFGDGDRARAAAAYAALATSSATGPLADLNRCVADLWRLDEGQTVQRPPLLTEEQALARDASTRALARRICHLVRGAQWLSRVGGADHHVAVDRLDRFLSTAPIIGLIDKGELEYVHLALARLYDQNGMPDRALQALRRRNRYNGWQPYLAGILRMEGRLAEAAGDTVAARKAYAHYLAFRNDVEPELEADVARVRAALRGLSAQ